MSDEISPYEELVMKVSKLLSTLEITVQNVDKMLRIIELHDVEIRLIKQKLKMENPGDINHLYQNWDKN